MQEASDEFAMAEMPEIERVVLLRGVVWQGKEVNAFKMWQDLMRQTTRSPLINSSLMQV